MSIYQGGNGEKINKTINSEKIDSKGILKFWKKVCIGYISALPPPPIRTVSTFGQETVDVVSVVQHPTIAHS